MVDDTKVLGEQNVGGMKENYVDEAGTGTGLDAYIDDGNVIGCDAYFDEGNVAGLDDYNHDGSEVRLEDKDTSCEEDDSDADDPDFMQAK